jgi:AraC family transcriptional regulator of adaptative response/methylated-DNA-[protein]-cysteine methyltransferase
MKAGFRACKRCRPLAPIIEVEPVIGSLLSALEARAEYRWTEDEIAAMGIDPAIAQRVFKRYFGMTFMDLARRQGFRPHPGGTALGAPRTRNPLRLNHSPSVSPRKKL